MILLDVYQWGGAIKLVEVNELLESNTASQKYGLVLKDAEAVELIEARNRAIQSHGRVELGIGVVKKIITAFCSSPYINVDDYVSTLNELIELFYYMKNETEDQIADDELIVIMQEFFNHSCRGSLDLLKNRELTLLAAKLRSDNQAREFSQGKEEHDETYRD